MKNLSIILSFILVTSSLIGRVTTVASNVSNETRSKPLVISQQQLQLIVDVANCRWSAQLKGTKVSINNA